MKGNTKTWFEKDVLPDELSIVGQISSILGNRFIYYNYEGTLKGKFFEGKMFIGFNIPYN
ncbi:DUF1579 family protein [Pedobacter mendelii]|uniref:Uncharacterized protein n=1 Tax=Pedobacter mendelii TaxID=1908240 RepID=A0ABQ2BPI7_9SPHI|nr:DUF1579 family protein [Pedobacter mendelii]GGI28427.1 hypothetical protein GCM10008119_32590 [Pedobacter mendelii]